TLAFMTDPAQRAVAREGLAQLGLTGEQYAAYVLGLSALRTLIYFALGVVVFAKRSNSLIAIASSLFLITYSPSNQGSGYDMGWGLALAAALIATIAYSSLILLFIFPDGRFVPRWTRYPAAIWVAFIALIHLPLPHWPLAL